MLVVYKDSGHTPVLFEGVRVLYVTATASHPNPKQNLNPELTLNPGPSYSHFALTQT